MTFTIEKTSEGWELTLGDEKTRVYEKLSRLMTRVEVAAKELDGAPAEDGGAK